MGQKGTFPAPPDPARDVIRTPRKGCLNEACKNSKTPRWKDGSARTHSLSTCVRLHMRILTMSLKTIGGGSQRGFWCIQEVFANCFRANVGMFQHFYYRKTPRTGVSKGLCKVLYERFRGTTGSWWIQRRGALSPIHAFLQLPCKNLRPSNVGPQSAEQSGTPRRAFLTTLARARNRPSGRPLPGHASQTLEGIGQNGQPAMRQLNNSEVTEPELAIEMIGLGAWNKCPPRTHNYTMRLFNPVSSTVLWAWRPRRGISVLPRNRTR